MLQALTNRLGKIVDSVKYIVSVSSFAVPEDFPMIAPSAARSVPARQIAGTRRFNRFYTRKIGVLEEGFVDSPFTLAEARVMYELAHRDATTSVALCRDLGLDAGYLSRILARFVKRG